MAALVGKGGYAHSHISGGGSEAQRWSLSLCTPTSRSDVSTRLGLARLWRAVLGGATAAHLSGGIIGLGAGIGSGARRLIGSVAGVGSRAGTRISIQHPATGIQRPASSDQRPAPAGWSVSVRQPWRLRRGAPRSKWNGARAGSGHSSRAGSLGGTAHGPALGAALGLALSTARGTHGSAAAPVAATLSAAALSAAHERSDPAHELAGERSARHPRLSKDGVPRTVPSACASIGWCAGMQQPAPSVVRHAAAIEEPRRRHRPRRVAQRGKGRPEGSKHARSKAAPQCR